MRRGVPWFAWSVCAIALALAGALTGDDGRAARAAPRWKVVGYDQSYRLVVLGAGDRQARRLEKGQSGTDDYSPAWSPDGRRVAFMREVADQPGHARLYALYVVTVADGRARRITGAIPLAGDPIDARFDPIAWSPNGRLIAVAHAAGVDVVPAGGGAVRRVYPGCHDDSWWNTRSAAWSPDGRRLVIACARELWIVAADGSGRRRLHRQDEYGVGAASWSPDGPLIAYGTRCEGVGHGDVMCDLTVVRADGTGRRTLIRHVHRPTGPSDSAPVWSSDGRLLVVIWGYDSRTVRVEPSSGAVRDVLKRAVRSLTAGPNGTFAFAGLEIRDRGGSLLLRRRTPMDTADIWLG